MLEWNDARVDGAVLLGGSVRVVLVVVGARDASATTENDVTAVETGVVVVNAEVLRGSVRVALVGISAYDASATVKSVRQGLCCESGQYGHPHPGQENNAFSS